MFKSDPSQVPEKLDQEIEKHFDNDMQEKRQNMFYLIKEKTIHPEEIIVNGLIKDNLGYKKKARSTKYKGVSKNGKVYQIQSSINYKNYYFCAIESAHVAA